MSPRRPILVSCLIAVVFATGGLGIFGGRVLCVGAGGHVAVAGAHDGPAARHCCGETDSQAAHEGASPSTLDCTDWSLDAQHADRSAAGCGEVRVTDFVPIDLAILAPIELGNPLVINPSSGVDLPFAQIPRAHLIPLATTLLLI